MKTVSFANMIDGSKQEYEFIGENIQQFRDNVSDRLMDVMKLLDYDTSGYQVTRYEHCLQSATRAHRDGREPEYVVAAVLHDIGDVIGPYSHAEVTAAIFRPFISPRICWVVGKHDVFQLYYYGKHLGYDPNARDVFKDHQWYDDAVEFCEKYDQNCFGKDYDWQPMEFFEPMIRQVFAQPRYLNDLVHPASPE